jgi:hypothetical protein
MREQVLKCCLFLLLLFMHRIAGADDQAIEWSGFGRLVAGQLNSEQSSYAGYDDDVSIRPNSLIGLQGEWQIDSQFSLIGQGVATASKSRGSDIEWLYLKYHYNNNWQVKLGQLNTPFFLYSDVQDVGYAYHWIQLPVEVYTDFMFKKFRGGSIRYTSVGEETTFDVEAYYGSMKDNIQIRDSVYDIDLDMLAGLVAKLSYSKLRFTASYHAGKYDIKIPQLITLKSTLSLIGFNDLAADFSTAGEAEYLQFGVSYDDLNFFARSELTYTKPSSRTISDYNSYYVMVGYIVEPVSIYASFAKRVSDTSSIINTVPKGINPVFDQLSYAVDSAANGFSIDSKSLSVGARWDTDYNIAYKVEVKQIRGNDFEFSAPIALSDNSTLVLGAIEWVF